MDTITAGQRAELVRRFREDEAAGVAAPGIADAIEQCGTDHGEDCDTCASLYEMATD